MEQNIIYNKKQLLKSIPYPIMFGAVLTLFFAVIGMIIQYFQAEGLTFIEILKDFFAKNYSGWLNSFASFADVTLYANAQDLVYIIFGRWYYFFYTSGFITMIWGLSRWILEKKQGIYGNEEKTKDIYQKAEQTGYAEQKPMSELDLFIKKSLAKGHTPDKIKEVLLKAGWKEETVNSALRNIKV